MATTTSVTSTASTVLATTTDTSAVATTTDTSAVSTLTSAAGPAADQSFSGQISSFVASVVDTIRNLLSKLPLIGHLFASGASTSTTGTTTTGSTTTTAAVYTDAQIVDMIKSVFVAPVASTTTTAATVAVPQADVVAYTLGVFAQVTSDEKILEALHAVLSATNSDDAIGVQFYNAMRDDMQTEFRRQMYLTNGGDDGRGLGFGHHIIATAVRGPLALQAALNYRAGVIAGTIAGTTTSASTASTASTTSTATSTTI